MGSTVVILGAGETAHDIAALTVTNSRVSRIIMPHRNSFFVAPKVTPEPVIMRLWGRPYEGKRPNKPIDTTVASLFDAAYVPACIQRGRLLRMYYEGWIWAIFWAVTGTSKGYDQWVGEAKGIGVDSCEFPGKVC